jgi:hypothetical protein
MLKRCGLLTQAQAKAKMLPIRERMRIEQIERFGRDMSNDRCTGRTTKMLMCALIHMEKYHQHVRLVAHDLRHGDQLAEDLREYAAMVNIDPNYVLRSGLLGREDFTYHTDPQEYEIFYDHTCAGS